MIEKHLRAEVSFLIMCAYRMSQNTLMEYEDEKAVVALMEGPSELVIQYWIVSPWLGDQLLKRGER
jgi:hypothetical protein